MSTTHTSHMPTVVLFHGTFAEAAGAAAGRSDGRIDFECVGVGA